MKLFEALKGAVLLLKDSTTPSLDAQLLLAFVLKRDLVYLLINRDRELECDLYEKYMALVERRAKGEPMQYITGNREFMGLDFNVRSGVLIPRPDTEILVEKALNLLENIKNPIVIDVGTGSGAIAVSIAKFKEDSFVYALDIMDIPLKTAEENALLNGVSNRVSVLKSNLFEGLDENIKADLIVSNPPYIREDVIKTLMREVKDYEPHEALSGGDDGLNFYRKISSGAKDHLKDGGLIAFEIGYDQGDAVSNILLENGFTDIDIKKDLSGLDRVVSGRLI